MLALFTLATFGQNKDDYIIVDQGTLANSALESTVINLDRTVGVFDSLKFTVVATGEIDIDTLRVQGGVAVGLTSIRGIAKDTTVSFFEATEAAVMTLDNADGVTTIVQNVMTLTAAECSGYNQIRVMLRGAASGNDATDQKQNFIVIMQVYRPDMLINNN